MANATAVGSVYGGASFVYNVNDTATRVLAAKRMKENIFMGIIHRNGKGVNETEETDASSVRMMKVKPIMADARELGKATNGGFFNSENADVSEVGEYDLNLTYLYDKMVDIPEVQQDMCSADILEGAMKNVAGRVNTEINASTLAHQLMAKYNQVGAMQTPAYTNKAVVLGSSDPDYYDAFLSASSLLDDGSEDDGVQTFPVEDRELIMRTAFRQKLMSKNGVLLGGSNYAQSMLAKGGVDPESRKENGTMYIGELDLTPCYICPQPIWNRVAKWFTDDTAKSGEGFVTNVEAILCAASATDRGISTPSYVKIIDSPDGAGKRLQPKTRWGINVCYPAGIVPILKNGTFLPGASSGGKTYAKALSITAPGNISST